MIKCNWENQGRNGALSLGREWKTALIGNEIFYILFYMGGPGSSVGIMNCLRAGLSGDRIPVGARFSAPVQTGPGTHPASCTMGIKPLPGVKSYRVVTLTPHTSPSAVGHERVELYLYSPCGPYGLYRASVPVQG